MLDTDLRKVRENEGDINAIEKGLRETDNNLISLSTLQQNRRLNLDPARAAIKEARAFLYSASVLAKATREPEISQSFKLLLDCKDWIRTALNRLPKS